jgi:hypothetical protein
MGSIWVAVMRISPAVRAKLVSVHSLDADEVVVAVQCVRGLQFAWHDHPARGRRALIQVRIRGAPVLVVLYPTSDPEIWNLGSAYRTGS